MSVIKFTLVFAVIAVVCVATTQYERHCPGTNYCIPSDAAKQSSWIDQNDPVSCKVSIPANNTATAQVKAREGYQCPTCEHWNYKWNPTADYTFPKSSVVGPVDWLSDTQPCGNKHKITCTYTAVDGSN